jgi:hypothetical protein
MSLGVAYDLIWYKEVINLEMFFKSLNLWEVYFKKINKNKFKK